MCTFKCPNCGAEYETGDDLRGKKVACSVCNFRFHVPMIMESIPIAPQAAPGQVVPPQYAQPRPPQYAVPPAGQYAQPRPPQYAVPPAGQYAQPQYAVPASPVQNTVPPAAQYSNVNDSVVVEQYSEQEEYFEDNSAESYDDVAGTEYDETQESERPAYNEGPATWVTCPHCWQHFDLRDIKYIARHPELQGDRILGEDAQLRFTPVRYSTRGMAIDARGMECPEMACPNCHLQIPEAIVELPSSIFSIVGAPSSGKSYFLTSMLWEARKSLPNYFEFNLADVDSSFNMVINNYEKLLFMNNRPDELVALPKTELQGGGFTNQITMNGFPVDLPKPFVFAMTPMQGHPGYETDRKNLQRNIILYDNAGEHFQPGQESVNNMATNHLAYSDGIIFVYDPLRDARMQSYCDKKDPQFQLESTNQLALFYEMATRVRKFSGIGASEKYSQPLIVAVAKFDVLEKSFGMHIGNKDFLYYDEESLEYSIDIQNVANISFQLRRKLLEIAPEFVGAAEGFSDAVYFVPVSAFGCSPQYISYDDDKQRPVLGVVPSSMKPQWIDVPLLLQFYLHGFINGRCKEIAGAEMIKNYKFTQDTIIFSFPETGVRCELPKTYWGMTLYSPESQSYWIIPEPEGFTRGGSCKATSLDEQIDNDFWNV